MKKIILTILVCVLLSISISAQTPAFTYQGSLKDGASTANGNYDFEFALFDAVSGGTQLGSTLSRNNVVVANGIFSVSLDFGSQFPGATRFLEIRVRLAGQPGITILGPRQQVNSAPYSVRSLDAANADVAANAAQLGGVAADQYVVTTDPRMTDARLPTAGSSNYIQNGSAQQASSDFNVSGTGTANIFNASQYNIGGTRILKTSTFNIFLGVDSGTNTTTEGNTFVGGPSGSNNTTGFGNSFFGAGTGTQNTTGSGNTYVGYQSGLSFLNNNNTTLIGNSTSASGGLTNATAIGSSASVSQSNSVVIGNNANVGIGTSAPNYKLHVRGENVRVEGDTASVFPRFSLNFTGGAFNEKKWQNYASLNGLNFSALNDAENSESLWLKVNRGSGLAISSIVFPAGNVGIGVGAPMAKLHVGDGGGNLLIGNGGCGGSYEAIGFASSLTCSNYSILGDGTDTIINRPTGGSISFRENNATQMRLEPGGTISIGVLGAAGATQLCRNNVNQISTCSSSLRYKTNIGQFSAGLSFVNKLRPISFDWKDGGMKDVGFGAEDVAKIDPRFVTHNDKGEVEGVKYDRLSVAFVNAFKEQQAQIERQQSLIEKQQDEIENLKAVVCSIKPDAELCKK